MLRPFRVAVALGLLWMAALPSHGAPLALATNDVIAWVGGSDVAAALFTGHVETWLAIKYPTARARNFGWEGDTVFSQPRDVNFPPTAEHLKRAGATVLLLQFGRTEALNGRYTVEQFSDAFEKLATECARLVPRVVVVTPAPFENGGPPLPDLSGKNAALAAHVEALRAVATKHQWAVIDCFNELRGNHDKAARLTSDGLNLTPRGQAVFAEAFMRQAGWSDVIAFTGPVAANGAWLKRDVESLRQLVCEKDRLWFNYWRPQNWAFLGGDRVTQPSSRDHRDPSIRWFPAEMERYVPLIRAQEDRIAQQVAALRKESK